MKLIKDFISKPSEAVQLMIDGLRNQSKRPDFKIDMHNFGKAENGICYGCAATCALQEMTGVNFTPENIERTRHKAEAAGMSWNEVDKFEDAIDDLRAGNIGGFEYKLGELIDFKKPLPMPHEKFFLHTDNWEKQLPLVEQYVEQLKAAGL